MPNYCDCDLYIEGSKEDVTRLVAMVASHDRCFDFDRIIPYPAHFAERDADRERLSPEDFLAKYGSRDDGFNSGGYEWCTANRGTKWNACDPVILKDTGGPLFRFKTAWAPPLPVIKRLAELFPEVTISLEYFEQGMEFCGGVAYVPKDDWYHDESWEPGRPESEWVCRGYQGRRGG